MREIEFRVWDKQEQVMMYSDIEIFDDMIGFRFGHFGIDQEFELMQYTGLKDKNSTKIFEGDIVIYPDEVFEEWQGVVEFYNGLYTADGGNPLSDNRMIKVIGNIHDNPELLESKQ